MEYYLMLYPSLRNDFYNRKFPLYSVWYLVYNVEDFSVLCDITWKILLRYTYSGEDYLFWKCYSDLWCLLHAVTCDACYKLLFNNFKKTNTSIAENNIKTSTNNQSINAQSFYQLFKIKILFQLFVILFIYLFTNTDKITCSKLYIRKCTKLAKNEENYIFVCTKAATIIKT